MDEGDAAGDGPDLSARPDSRPLRPVHADVYAASIGSTLDVMKTARETAAAARPLGDVAMVYLSVACAAGREPPLRYGEADLELECGAVDPAEGWQAGLIEPGQRVQQMPDTEIVRLYQTGRPAIARGLAEIRQALKDDPAAIRSLVPARLGTEADQSTTCVFAPLVTPSRSEDPESPGYVLGSLQVWYFDGRAPAEEDIEVQLHVAQRAALALDNARRYTRERTLNDELQRSMLRVAPLSSGVLETAARYVSGAHSGVGGDWWDVIGLPGLRVALVVGDVVGHGFRATAMMGQLRTAVRTLADGELPPDEALTRLDDLTTRLTDPDSGQESPTGSTCLYAVYDPVWHLLHVASAGHPPPLVVGPDHRVEYLPVAPGPVLGVGRIASVPYEVTTARVEPGSIICLYSDGLVGDHRDLTTGMEALRERLSNLELADLDQSAAALLALAPGTDDDATLLLARVHGVPPGDTAAWQFTADEAEVSTARRAVTGWLRDHDAPDDLVTNVELITSELVTNAVRYGRGPVADLRLIRNGSRLIIEVRDASDTAPHLRRAQHDDEGGRGLLIVARLAFEGQWGVRHSPRGREDDPLSTGKTVWVECSWHAKTPVEVFTFDLEGL